ncbi:MAG: alpha/beta fold hydrolase [Rhodospirillaceae bacterium]
MPALDIRGAHINYEIVGRRGPWVALMPGGRRPLSAVRSLANRIAAAGYRVLLHDRRNWGASDVIIEGAASESEIWAEGLHELLQRLGALPAYVGGGSSGCRTSLIYARHHPQAVMGLLLWRITGGAFAARRLAEQYYGQYIRAARSGGMQAVCDTEHFRERIAARPENGERLRRMDTQHFIDVMSNWSQYFDRDAGLPVIGASATQLRALGVPTCIVPGNDNTHPRSVGETMHSLAPGSELRLVFPEHVDVDMVPPEVWAVKEGDMAAMFLDFMRRHSPRA